MTNVLIVCTAKCPQCKLGIVATKVSERRASTSRLNAYLLQLLHPPLQAPRGVAVSGLARRWLSGVSSHVLLRRTASRRATETTGQYVQVFFPTQVVSYPNRVPGEAENTSEACTVARGSNNGTEVQGVAIGILKRLRFFSRSSD